MIPQTENKPTSCSELSFCLKWRHQPEHKTDCCCSGWAFSHVIYLSEKDESFLIDSVFHTVDPVYFLKRACFGSNLLSAVLFLCVSRIALLENYVCIYFWQGINHVAWLFFFFIIIICHGQNLIFGLSQDGYLYLCILADKCHASHLI